MQFDEARPFGVEIEAIGLPFAQVISALRAAGIRCEDTGYTHSVTPYWKVVHDGSLAGGYTFELVSPKLYGQAGLNELETVMRLLREAGARVNSSCGFHVHHSAEGMQEINHANVAYAYNYFYSLFEGIFPVGRQNSTWARRLSSPETAYTARAHGLYDVRYMAVNLNAVTRHGTVEFRQHAGTLNASKATAWVVFTQLLMQGALKWRKRGGMRTADPTNHYNLQRRFKTFLGAYTSQNPTYDEATTRCLRFMQRRSSMRWGRMLAAGARGQAEAPAALSESEREAGVQAGTCTGTDACQCPTCSGHSNAARTCNCSSCVARLAREATCLLHSRFNSLCTDCRARQAAAR